MHLEDRAKKRKSHEDVNFWDRAFITYAAFSEKLTFLVRNVSFSENFAYVLNK